MWPKFLLLSCPGKMHWWCVRIFGSQVEYLAVILKSAKISNGGAFGVFEEVTVQVYAGGKGGRIGWDYSYRDRGSQTG
jgi:hypothetical protein